jgi:nitroreductase
LVSERRAVRKEFCAQGRKGMKSFWEVIDGRRSVRRFDREREVGNEDILKLLEAAVRAPNAGNAQPWRFKIVRDPAKRSGLARAALGQRFIASAPVCIVVCAHLEEAARAYGERGVRLYCLQDTAAATEHMLLAAVALELGACWVGAFDEAAVATVLGLPREERPVALIPVGHPVSSPRPGPRRDLSEVVSWV